MEMRFLSPAEVAHTMELAQSNYRPAAILNLKAEIEGDTRVVELRATVMGVVDEAAVVAIVEKRLQLDALYGAWVTGKLE